MNFEPISIEWEKNRLFIDSFDEWEKNIIISSPENKEYKDDCLYQAYGDSPIYGRDVLLYIGRTENFLQRTKDHKKTDFNRVNNLSLVKGTLEANDLKKLDPKKAIKLAEALLITMLKPSLNSSNIKNTHPLLRGSKNYIVLNKGNRMDLPLEVSNYWW